MNAIRIVMVDNDYIEYLNKFDHRVYQSKYLKERPYVGALITVNDMEYFAPLSSPKPKHLHMKNSIDFLKIENESFSSKTKKTEKKLIGVVNFNNMIPLTKNNYKIVDFDQEPKDEKEKKYLNLLKMDFIFLYNHREEVYQKSYNIYHSYQKGYFNEKMMNRCCNFPLLEEKCLEYNGVTV